METHVYKELPLSALDDIGSALLKENDSFYYKTCFNKVSSEIIIQLINKGLLARREVKRLLPKLESGEFEILPDDTFSADNFPSITNDRTGQRLKFYRTKTNSESRRQSEIMAHFTKYKVKMTPEEIVRIDEEQAAFSKALRTGMLQIFAASISSEILSARSPHTNSD